ncbi:MAG: glycosyltransferase [Sulfuritalea sp.]|nr:glycosyltransferase [Sulfuritalea sp.]
MQAGSTLSLIVPVYNVAPYLPRMRVIRQENSGLSAARNTGLDAAHGKYLAFVDSDDFVSPDAYAEALRLADDEQLDMVLLNANCHFEGREKDYAIYTDAQVTGVVPGSEWLPQRQRTGRFLHMVWMHLYRRDFIESQGYRFVPRLIHEDVIWTTRALLAAPRVRYTGHVAVHYRILLRSFSPEQSQRRLLDEHLVDGALSVFHKLAKMPDRQAAAATLCRLRRQGFLRLLWRHARDNAQHRRIARHWLRSWLAGGNK